MGRLLSSGAALGEAFRNPSLRRLQLAWVGSILGSWAYFVALAVYAYGQGGAKAVALIGVLRVIPAAILAPFLGSLADRFPRRLVMVSADFVRAALMGLAAAVIALSGPAWVVYGLVTLSTLAGTPFRPAQAALLPELAGTPTELTAANIASSTLESAGSFIGPAIGGFVLAATNAQVVFALNGASFVWSAALVLSIRVSETVDRAKPGGDRGGRHMLAGFRTIREDRDVGALVGLYAAQTLVAGALGVLVVVTALDLLHGGPKDVGLLDAATGVGGLAGSLVALGLAARGRLATDLGLGLALFGALAFIGLTPHLGPAIVALGVVGIGNTLVDIAAITLLQRIVPNELLGRVLGLLQGILLACFGIGAAAAPLLVDAFGVRTTLIAVGAVLPLLTAISWTRLRRIDATNPAPRLSALLRGVEILEPLPAAALERLTAALGEVRLPAGAVVIREGEPGDRFYVVEDGVVKIEGNVFGPGSSFGEIALLRDVPRTATVTADTDVILQALERDDFLAAVTQHEASSAAADAVIARRLGELRADLTTERGAA
jgi:MFS family permease